MAGRFYVIFGRRVRARRAPGTTTRRVVWLAAAGLVASVLAGGAIPAAAAVAAVAAPSTVPVGHAAVVPLGSTQIGPRSASATLRLDVALAPRDPTALDQFLQQVYDPTSPAYHHFLARGSFGPRFGAAPSTIDAVDSALSAVGLTPGPVSSDGMIVPVSTTVGQAESAFGTSIVQYRLRSGRIAFGNTAAPKVPAPIAPDVVGVLGLSDLQRAHPALEVGHSVAVPASVPAEPGAAGLPLHAAGLLRPAVVPSSPTPAALPRASGPSPCSAATADTVSGGYTANQIATAYGFGTGAYAHGLVGTGETVAVAELEPYAASDIAAFESCYSISTPVDTIPVDGGAGTGSGSGEAALDIENIASLAPGATIDVYEAPGVGTGLLDMYQTIASQDTAAVVSTSWGLCEAGLTASVARTEEAVFEQMAAQGQSMVAAAGDSGSEDCYAPPANTDTALQVDDPASDPYVTGVGGTSLTAIGPPPTETVWNNGSLGYGAGGGGISQLWPMPTWQTALGVNANSSGTPCSAPSGTSCREVPDVSANADPNFGYAIYFAGGWNIFGGTSAAAPVWAAFTALADEGCGSDARAGLLNPALYTHASDLHDVTSGNNDYTGTNGGLYPATTGYDMATGLGTPTAALLAPGVLCSSSTPTGVSVSPSNRHGGQAATWTVGFTASATGALTAGTGTVTVTAPSSTTFPSAPGDYTVNGVTATSVPSAGAGTATIDVPVAVAAGTTVTVVVSHVTNPAAGTYPAADFTVATSADITAAQPSAAVGFGSGVSAVTIGSSSAVAAGVSTWTAGFTSSATGALGTGDTVTVTAPSSTTFPSAPGDYTVNGVTATSVPSAGAGSATIDVPVAVAAGTPVTVVVSQVTNPAAGTYPAADFTVATTADAGAAPTAGLSFASGVTAVTVSPSSNASGQAATWTIGFAASASGALTTGTGSVTVTAPSSTTFPSAPGDYTVNGVIATSVPSAGAGTATIDVPVAVAAGTPVTVVVSHVTNPAAGTYPATDFTVATSADVTAAEPGTGLTFTGPPSRLAFTVEPPANTGAGATFPVAVSVEDSSGVVVTSDHGTSVTLAITAGTGTSGATLHCAANPVTDVLGVATFSCSISTSGSGFTLGASSSPALTGAVSAAVDVASPPAAPTSGGGSGAPAAATTTVTTVSSSDNPSAPGQQVIYTATVAPVPDGGSISFTDGGTAISGCGAVGVSTTSGDATCSVTYGAAGSRTIQARYSGDTKYAASASTTLDQVVAIVSAPTAVSVSVSPLAVAQGGSVTYTAQVSSSSSLSPATGTVAFSIGSLGLCTATLAGSGSATCTATGAPVGTDTVTARYSGDPTHGPSAGTTTLSVTPKRTSPGGGYWMVGADGGVFSFGDAGYFGSVPGVGVHVGDIVGMAATPDGRGYWMVGANGGVFSFGDAGYVGSAGQLDPTRPPGRTNGIYLAAPITNIMASPDGGGYWLVGANGEIVPLGDAAYSGSLPGDFISVGDVVGAATVP